MTLAVVYVLLIHPQKTVKKVSYIKNKQKKCRGNGKAKGSGCGEITWIKRYGLCESCYKKWLLNTEEGKKHLKKIALKVQAPRIKAEESLKKAELEHTRRKKLSYYLKDTQIHVHKYIRERDKNLPCISCGTPYDKSFQAGHFYKAELYSALKFDFDNIHGQCTQCNIRKEGNLNDYEIGLGKKLGKKTFESLKNKAKAYKKTQHLFKWDIEELKKIRAEAKFLYKKLKNV